MKQIIEDIRYFMTDGAFRDKLHVRFSLVGGICQALDWYFPKYPIWDTVSSKFVVHTQRRMFEPIRLTNRIIHLEHQ